MESFMVVCTFTPDTLMADVMTVVAEEQAAVAVLKEQGRIGSVFLATRDRRTVFLEVFAADGDDAKSTVLSLPMAKWWDLDLYPLNPPAPVG